MKKFAITIIFTLISLFLIQVGIGHEEDIYNPEIIKQKEEEYYYSPKKEKLVFEGLNELNSNSSTEEIKKELVDNQKDISIVLELDNPYPFENEKPRREMTMQEAKRYLRNHRSQVKNYFESTNQQIVSEINLPNEVDLYVSRYSPFVTIDMELETFLENDLEFLYELTENDNIITTYVSANDEYVPNLTSALPGVGLPRPADMGTLDYDGTGVVVGVLEAGGVIDINNTNFTNRDNIFVRDEWYYFESHSQHADLVAAIIGGNHGIATNCTILSVELAGNPISEVEWMLDRDVNIINNSWSEVNKSGNYKSNAAYFDYISRLNWIVITASAGNDGDVPGKEWVGNPGLGFNVVTVGASTDGTSLASYSSFKENFAISKPTLVAPGNSITVTDCYLASGTSFSSPIVAAAITLLMDQYPLLMAYPELVLAMLTASATKMSSTYNDYDTSGLENKVGAGKLNYQRAQLAYNNRLLFSNDTSTTGEKKSKSVYLNAGQTIRISLAWIVNSNNKTNTNIVTDYDLYLKNSSGNVLKVSASGSNNIEFIEYVAPTAGNYYISVYQYGELKGTRDYLAVSWLIT